jgi:Core-2/I-Branching enzyme
MREEGRRMKIAFFISAYKLERQFEWLFKSIWNQDDIFLVHLSTTATDEYVRKIQRITEGLSNVHFLPRMQITWGGWSLVEMNLAAIRFFCGRPEEWDYFVNLSGQDYPVRSLGEFRDFLSKHNGTNFVSMKHIDTQPFHIRRRLHWYCVEYRGQLRRFPIPNVRAMLAPVTWYGGLWCNLSRAFCDWLDTDEMTHVFRRALRHTKIPDEFFFQSIIMQSPFAHTVNLDPGRYLEFEVQASGPKTLTSKDLERMLVSPAFFARKFDETVDADVLCELASKIGATAPQAT